MAVIRSSRLFVGYGEQGVRTVFTCPAGYRAILRAADFAAILTGVEVRSVWLEITTAQAEYGWLLYALMTSDNPTVHYRGQCVLNSGDFLAVNVNGGQTFYQGSGALLPITAS